VVATTTSQLWLQYSWKGDAVYRVGPKVYGVGPSNSVVMPSS
jgi:hypothetical protein